MKRIKTSQRRAARTHNKGYAINENTVASGRETITKEGIHGCWKAACSVENSQNQ